METEVSISSVGRVRLAAKGRANRKAVISFIFEDWIRYI